MNWKIARMLMCLIVATAAFVTLQYGLRVKDEVVFTLSILTFMAASVAFRQQETNP